MSTLSSKDLDYPRPWRLWKAGERSEIPHIADANGIVIARAEGNIWTWQDFVAPVILAAVNDHERLQLVFEEACNEVKMSHGKPCFCKYCWEPSEATPGGGSTTNQPVARGVATGPALETNEEPSVMGGAFHPAPMPTSLDAIEAHVRQIQQICDASNLDPTQWLNDYAAQGETAPDLNVSECCPSWLSGKHQFIENSWTRCACGAQKAGDGA